MIGYVSVGSNDLDAAKRFYDAVLLPLGWSVTRGPEGLGYLPRDGAGAPDYYVKPPFDGRPASTGNGSMTAFAATDPAQVRALHAAGQEAGGTDDGAPGHRATYSPTFYVGYLRDPDGHKIALYAYARPGGDGAV
ncbi:MAG: VOC family protein [Shimia sp.]